MCHGECRVSFVIVGATGLQNVSTFGKLDPYVKITYGKSVYKTSIIHDGGTSPRWNYEMCLTGTDPDLKVEVFDSRFIKDKLIGYADIHLSSLPFGRQDMNVNLTTPKGSGSAGILRVIFKVYGDSPQLYCPPSCCACYTATCMGGSNYGIPYCSCLAVPVHSLPCSTLPPSKSTPNSYQPFITNSCVLQEVPNSYCRVQTSFMKYAVPTTTYPVSVDSRLLNRPAEYRKAIYSDGRALTPTSSVYPTI